MVQTTSPPSSARTGSPGGAELRYRLESFREEWIIPEVPVPESAWHDGCLELLKALLVAWVARTERDAAVFRDIAVLMRPENRKVGFNPDVCVVEPAPERAPVLESMKLWEHSPPRLAFEVVSPNHPYKDYAIVPEKCAVTGIDELVVFDPLLAGPRSLGGPWLLQVWQRTPDGAFERVYTGDGPARSYLLDAWLVPNRLDRRLRIADKADGSELWLTPEEVALERAKQAIAHAAEAQRREQALLLRVAELERALGERGSSEDQ
jgi:Uma2 family endonuclease